jgi:hypothetical protein
MEHYFRFTTRHLIVAIAVAGLAFGWLVDHGRLSVEIERYRKSNLTLSQQVSDLTAILGELQRKQSRERMTFPATLTPKRESE